MTIAVDIDEVLSELMIKFLEYYNDIHKTSFTNEHFYCYNWARVFNISEEKKNEIYGSFCALGHLRDLKTIEGSVDGIKRIKKKHKLIIITNRALTLKNDTEHWLKRHYPHSFEKIIYTKKNISGLAKSKHEICQEINANLIIEDDATYADNFANGKTKLLLFSQPWNQRAGEHDNLVRVHSWNDIYNVINNI